MAKQGDELTIGQWLEQERQAQSLMESIALVSLVYQILTSPPPPKREHWWQFWRSP